MRRTLTRLTFDLGTDEFPVWTPDSRRIIFQSVRGGPRNLYWQAADNTGMVERLTTSPNQQTATSISPDGKHVAFMDFPPKTGLDIAVLTLDDKRSTDLLVHTAFQERNPEFSADGRWIAYESNDSGRYQIYVRPFPNVDTGRWQISTEGGTRPAWSRNGKELFYLDQNDKLTAVQVQTAGSNFTASTPVKLFDTRIATPINGRTYDVSADGQRFLIIKDNASPEQTSNATPASMVVVLNWLEELKARVGTK